MTSEEYLLARDWERRCYARDLAGEPISPPRIRWIDPIFPGFVAELDDALEQQIARDKDCDGFWRKHSGEAAAGIDGVKQ